MRHPRVLRGSLASVVAGWIFGSIGCTHNYYYGTAMPVCGPTTAVPGAVSSSSSVCEIPSTVSGGTVVSQGTTGSTIVSSAPIPSGSRPPRVVVSQPRTGPFGRWRQSDPESGLAQTKVEGGLDDETSTR